MRQGIDVKGRVFSRCFNNSILCWVGWEKDAEKVLTVEEMLIDRPSL